MDSAGSEMKAGDPTDLQDRILERLQTNGPATAGSLARALGVAEELVLSALFRCRKRGLVQLDEKFRWSINPDSLQVAEK
jgi:predicted ArsR family transcriptional regulator